MTLVVANALVALFWSSALWALLVRPLWPWDCRGRKKKIAKQERRW